MKFKQKVTLLVIFSSLLFSWLFSIYSPRITLPYSPTATFRPALPPPRTNTPTPSPEFSTQRLRGHSKMVSPVSAEQIPASVVTVYPYNRLTDYVYARNGDLWLIGGFGVLRQQANGQQTWYSMQNGLPANYFQAIAISPQGEIWVGGTENTLLRFNGHQWHDETDSLLALPQDSPWWTCRTRNIFGIDFDENGQIWVANGGIHLYTRENGQWKQANFLSDLPQAGGGGCPVGLRVINANHITIVRNGCCDMPMVAHHFDGQQWTQDQNIQEFTQHLAARRAGLALNLQARDLRESNFPFPFPPEQVLPLTLHPMQPFGELTRLPRFGDISLAFDEQGTLWLNNDYTLFENQRNRFERHDEILLVGEAFVPEFQTARWLDFPGDPVILNPDGRAVEFSRWFWQQTALGNRYFFQMSQQATEWNAPWLYFSRDRQGRVWFYLPGEGLVSTENGQMTTYPGPADLTLPVLGGLQVLKDGRVLVGTAGAVWVFAQGAWQKWVFPDTHEIFWRFSEDAHGIVYAATDSAVYRIVSGEYTRWQFPPLEASRVLLLSILPNDRLIYANSSILAGWDGTNWQAYHFKRVSFSSVAFDAQGNLWAYAGYNGLIRFCSQLFQP
ncbi:MAG: hypothetical protein DDG60_06905 [Anaerolineae bacterium]|nr:MAG: hypothetical protein DDG60_06905 [Anaerolineae bacterium]